MPSGLVILNKYLNEYGDEEKFIWIMSNEYNFSQTYALRVCVVIKQLKTIISSVYCIFLTRQSMKKSLYGL